MTYQRNETPEPLAQGQAGEMPEIAAIRAALAAGPTPGRWYIGKAHTDDAGYVELPVQADINGKQATAAVVCLQFPRVPGMQDANAKHIVACSPAAVTAVLNHFDAALQAKDAEIARLKADAGRLTDAGLMLPNFAFNAAHREGRTLTADDCASLKLMYERWDAAMKGEAA